MTKYELLQSLCFVPDSGIRPSELFEEWDQAGVIKKEYPELFALKNVPQEPTYHPEGDVWTHTMMALDAAADIIKRDFKSGNLIVLLAVLCHDFGKPAVTAKDHTGRIRALRHSEEGVAPARRFLERLGLGDSVIDKVEKLILEHLSPVSLYKTRDEIRDAAIVRLLMRLEPATLEELLAVSEADQRGRGGEWKGYPTRDWLMDKVASLNLPKRKAIKVMADYVSEGISTMSDPIGIDLHNYYHLAPELVRIKEEILNLMKEYDSNYKKHQEDPEFPFEDYHNRLFAAAHRLAVALKPFDIDVYYDRAFEDPKGRFAVPAKIKV